MKKKSLSLILAAGLLGSMTTVSTSYAKTKSYKSKRVKSKSKRLKRKRAKKAKRRVAYAQYPSEIHSGFKVSVGMSNTKITETQSTTFFGDRIQEKESYTRGSGSVLLGYQLIKPKSWGWSTFFERTGFEKGSDTDYSKQVYLNSVEGNATYGMSDAWYLAFGGGLSRFTSDDSDLNNGLLEDLGVGVGFQFLFGYQVARYFSIETKIFATNHTAEYTLAGEEFSYSIATSGLKLNLSGTF